MKKAKVRVLYKKGKKYKNGTSPILIEIYRNRNDVATISTAYSVNMESWDFENNQVYNKKPTISSFQKKNLDNAHLTALKEHYKSIKPLSNGNAINNEVELAIDDIKKIINRLDANGESYTANKIKEIYSKPTKSNNTTFNEYAQKIIENYEATDKHPSARKYKPIIKEFVELVGRKNLLFEDINNNMLGAYRAKLVRDKNHQNTIHKKFKVIRSIFNFAKKEKVIEQTHYPIYDVVIKKEVGGKIMHLSDEEFNVLKDARLQEYTPLWHAKNYFMFCYFTAGMRVGELITLKWESINEIDGRLKLEYVMRKNNKFQSFFLSQQAIEILNIYDNDDKKKEHFVFPFLKNNIDYSDSLFLTNQIQSKTAYYNTKLKKIAKLLDINEQISSHFARHTFVSMAKKKKDAFEIGQLINHSDVSTTIGYLARFDENKKTDALNDIYE